MKTREQSKDDLKKCWRLEAWFRWQKLLIPKKKKKKKAETSQRDKGKK
jgi:hypothetical protein